MPPSLHAPLPLPLTLTLTLTLHHNNPQDSVAPCAHVELVEMSEEEPLDTTLQGEDDAQREDDAQGGEAKRGEAEEDGDCGQDEEEGDAGQEAPSSPQKQQGEYAAVVLLTPRALPVVTPTVESTDRSKVGETGGALSQILRTPVALWAVLAYSWCSRVETGTGGRGRTASCLDG